MVFRRRRAPGQGDSHERGRSAQLLGALRNLERRTTQEFMDKGLWVLYLGIGLLEWVNVEGDEHERVQSPLLHVPGSVAFAGFPA